jgi:hypothetical protein
MPIRKLISACLLSMSMLQIHAQQLSPTAINSSGYSITNNDIFLEGSFGETFTEPYSNAVFDMMLTQGLLQPDKRAGIPVRPRASIVFPSGIDNAGNSVTANGIFLENTIGEFATATLSSTNYMLTQGILQPYALQGALPVFEWQFAAKRLDAAQVQLDWRTQQEQNNKGFFVERKLQQEGEFKVVEFVDSKAPAGNSSLSLQYNTTDANAFNGKSFYRLKQVDLDGVYTYSPIRIVDGNEVPVTLAVWPVPATGPLHLQTKAATKNIIAIVYDNNGRTVQQLLLLPGAKQTINDLKPGTYFIKTNEASIPVIKAIVQ